MLYRIKGKGFDRTVVARPEAGMVFDRTEMARFTNLTLRHCLMCVDVSERFYAFQIGEKLSLGKFLEEERSLEEILGLIEQCVVFFKSIIDNNFFLSFVEYDFNQIWLDDDGKIHFIYIPTEDMRAGTRIIDFLLNILAKVRIQDKESYKEIVELREIFLNLPQYSGAEVLSAIENIRNMVIKRRETRRRKTQIRSSDEATTEAFTLANSNRGGSQEVVADLSKDNHNASGDNMGKWTGEEPICRVCNVSTGEVMEIDEKDILKVEMNRVCLKIKTASS